MRVHVHPADDGGCGHYRLTWPARVLQSAGEDVHLEQGLPAQFVDDPDPRVVGCDPVEADVVVLQRPLQRHLADIIPHLQAQGIAVVVEIDDDFAALDPRNVSFSHVHPLTHPDRNWNHLQRACRQADLVTCTTPALARRYGAHGRVHVLPNCVPARYLDVQHVDYRPGVGWTGSVDTHPGDLEVTRGGVARAVHQADVPFRVVGTGVGVARRLQLTRPVEACGWVPIEEYPERVAELGVGIVPLQQSKFNHAKSWLKGIEMAAVGVPFVASPTDDYRRLHDEGAGWLADKPRQWEHLVRLLLTNDAVRVERAEAGRAVAARWTIEGNAWRWLEAWTDAADQRSRRAA